MTDTVFVQGNSYAPGKSAALSGKSASANLVISHSGPEQAKVLDLRDSLEWLLGGDTGTGLSCEEKSVNRERRADLLIWLLNLESRLGPYVEPA